MGGDEAEGGKEMMRLLVGIFLLACFVGNCYAGQSFITGYDTFSGTPIDAVTLDDSPTSVTSSAIDCSKFRKVIFWVDYDETEDGGGVSGSFTIQVSVDGTNYETCSFYDFAGGASTFQTSESFTADGSYICWLEPSIMHAYVKVIMTGTNTDTNDTILVTVKYAACY